MSNRYTYRINPPKEFIMPMPYIERELPIGWEAELGNPHPNIIKTFWGKYPSDAFNTMLDYIKFLKDSAMPCKMFGG